MAKMLINATQKEEIRVALVENNHLYDLDIECPGEHKKKGNIYKAIVTRREPSLGAVFVEYGSKRQGFLPLKEIAPEYFMKQPEGDEKLPITSLIREKQELLIQIDKEERGNKGAALTTFITLAGCYLVLMPNSPRSGGISRRIEGDDRDELKETLNALQMEEDMGVIIRTAGVGKSQEELQADLDMLCKQWQAIKTAYNNQLAPCLIHQEGDVIIRSIRDNLRKSINEIIIDDHASYIKAKQYIEQIKPEFLPNLKLYRNNIPLFNFYQVESQIESAYRREVPLPSGGALVIDRTEALVSIDINSAKSTSGPDIETTALNTNLEAADEIARQLRLRDLGGLVVIDFIDMSSSKNQRDVENRLKEALKADRARIQVGRISRFGLLEMSRQRLRLSLGENTQDVCPHCEGRGTVRNIQSQSLSLIRLIEEAALKEKTAHIQIQLPVDMATYLINEKREVIQQIEKRHQVSVLIIPNPYIQAPHYLISSVKENGTTKNKASFELVQKPSVDFHPHDTAETTIEEPIVKAYIGQTPFRKKEPNLLTWLWHAIFKQNAEATQDHTAVNSPKSSSAGTEHKNHHRQGSSRRRHHHSKSHGQGQGSQRNPQYNNSSNTNSNNQQTQNQHSAQRKTNANAKKRQATTTSSVKD